MLPTTSKSQVIHINPAFKEQVLQKIKNTEDEAIRSTTAHINPLFIEASQTVTKIHMNPEFLRKEDISTDKANDPALPLNMYAPDKESHNTTSKLTFKDAPLNKIISKSKTRIVRESQPRLLTNPARQLLFLTKRKLIRAATSTVPTATKSKDCPKKKQKYKVDNRFGTLFGVTKFLKRRPNAFVAQYALRRSNSNLISGSLSNALSRHTLKLKDSPTAPASNKRLRLININGIFYKSTGTKLQRKNESTITSSTSSYNATKSNGKSVPTKQNPQTSGHTFHIRGSKYIMDRKGFKLTRIGANYQTKALTNVVSTRNLTLPRRIDVGGITYKASNKAQNVYVRTTTHLALAHLSQAKYRSVYLLSRSLRKTNKPCLIFQRLGKCAALERNRCSKVHDKQRVIVCPKFLQNNCSNPACLLSHNKTFQKMPVCKFFLQGSCVRTDCPYLHKKLSEDTGICEDFRRGFCALAEQCNKQHIFPKVASKSKQNEILSNTKDNKPKTDIPTNRYFKGGNFVLGATGDILNCDNSIDTEPKQVTEPDSNDSSKSTEDSDEGELQEIAVIKRKLGSLPAFIPLS